MSPAPWSALSDCHVEGSTQQAPRGPEAAGLPSGQRWVPRSTWTREGCAETLELLVDMRGEAGLRGRPLR